jgi:hypothetical protein
MCTYVAARQVGMSLLRIDCVVYEESFEVYLSRETILIVVGILDLLYTYYFFLGIRT